MKYKINSLMKERLKGKDILKLAKQHSLEPKLKEIINKGIDIQDGVAVLKWMMKDKKVKKYTPDLVELEMNINEISMHPYIPKKRLTRDYVLQQGIAFAYALKNELLSKHSKSKFKIILSTDEGQDSFPNVCNVWFHTIRSKEKQHKEDLESYKMNGLLVITV